MKPIDKIKLHPHYTASEQIAAIPSQIVSYTYKKGLFGWTYFYTYIFVAEVYETITKETLKKFSAACYQYAVKAKKERPILSSAIISIAVLVGDQVADDAIRYCKSPSKLIIAGCEIPVIYMPLSRNSN